jgi:hypothetical protein
MSNLSGDHLFTRVYGKTHVYVIIACKGSLSVLYNATHAYGVLLRDCTLKPRNKK